jgi:hypothetical protein
MLTAVSYIFGGNILCIIYGRIIHSIIAGRAKFQMETFCFVSAERSCIYVLINLYLLMVNTSFLP